MQMSVEELLLWGDKLRDRAREEFARPSSAEPQKWQSTDDRDPYNNFTKTSLLDRIEAIEGAASALLETVENPFDCDFDQEGVVAEAIASLRAKIGLR
jgi:hypothetical protein